MIKAAKTKLKEISDIIVNQKEVKIKTEADFIEKIVDYLNLRNTLQKYIWLKVAGYNNFKGLTMQAAIKYMDYGFKADQNCNNCKVCVKLCPVDNIKIDNAQPKWLHNCEQCFACLQWCPQKAIQYKKGTKNKKRYHHPDISLSEMINNKDKGVNYENKI